MKTRRAFVSLGLVLLFGTLLGACPNNATIVFINNSTDGVTASQIIEIYVTPSGSGDWGTSYVTNALARGERISIQIFGGAEYDILVRHTCTDLGADLNDPVDDTPQDDLYTLTNVRVYHGNEYKYFVSESGLVSAKIGDLLAGQLAQSGE